MKDLNFAILVLTVCVAGSLTAALVLGPRGLVHCYVQPEACRHAEDR